MRHLGQQVLVQSGSKLIHHGLFLEHFGAQLLVTTFFVMNANTCSHIEYLNGSVPIVRNDYHEEGMRLMGDLPPSIDHPTVPDVSTRVNNLRNSLQTEQNLINQGNELRREIEHPTPRPMRKEVHHLLSDDMRRSLTNIYMRNQGKVNAAECARELGLNEKTVQYYFRKLRKGESIERSVVRRGRHSVVSPECLAFIYNMFTKHLVHSDHQAANMLKQNGYAISRRTLERVLTNGTMEKNGYHSLTIQRVYYRGNSAQTEQNKERRIEAVSLLFSYMDAHYHPVFVDETHWSIGWTWKYQRGIVGEKNVVTDNRKSYSITSISAISDNGPCYTLVIEGNTVNADLFCDYMRHLVKQQEPRKVVFFMDNASIHKKEDVIAIVRSVKDKEIVFNAPYTPDCNPIEHFFSIWKRKVDELCSTVPSPATMIRYIESTFLSFTSDQCIDIINDMKKSWKNVLDRNDM